MNWPALATLAVVIVVYAAIYWLRSRRNLSFTSATLLALAAGVPIGLVAGHNVEYVDPIGKIYLNVLLTCVAPLVFIAIVSSIISLGNLEKLRSIGARSIGWLLLLNSLAVALALGLGLALKPGSGLHDQLGSAATSVIDNSVQSFTQTFIGFFPTNIVENFRANDVVPIIVVGVVLAIAYLSLAERKPDAVLIRPFGELVEALKLVIFKVVGYVVRLTPYAIVAITATTVGLSSSLGKEFWSLLGLLGLTWFACFFHAFVINGVLVRTVAHLSPLAFFRKIFPAQLTAFTTQSSVGTLPVTTSQLTRRVGVHPEVAYFTAPLGTTIGMPGCAGIWPMLIAVWGINAYGTPYSARDYAVLAILGAVVSIGTAGVPGAATVSAATVLSAAGLPLEFVAVTLPISTIADMARTMTNVTAAATSSTIVARQTGLLDEEIFAGRAEFVEEEPALPEIDGDPSVPDVVEELDDGKQLVGGLLSRS